MSFERNESREKPEITIDEARPDDADAILAAMDDAEERSYSFELQKSGEGQFFVAREGNDIVGMVTLRYRLQISHWQDIKGPFIQGVFVRSDHRREGVAGKLVAACEEEIRGRGGKELLLTVEADNKPAVRLYEARGYEKIPDSDCGPDGPEVAGALSNPGYYMRKELGD